MGNSPQKVMKTDWSAEHHTRPSVQYIQDCHNSVVMATSDELCYRNCRLMPSLGAAEVIRRPEVAMCVETVPEVVWCVISWVKFIWNSGNKLAYLYKNQTKNKNILEGNVNYTLNIKVCG